jgi:hypothetical protein
MSGPDFREHPIVEHESGATGHRATIASASRN